MPSLLSRLFDYEKRPFGFAAGGRPFDLTGFAEWLAEIGIDHSRMAFLHIAGTKGKGSTAAFCEAMLRGVGYRTGMYSSPHLSHFGERIRIDGVPLTEREFDEALERFVDSLPAAHRQRLFDDPQWRTVFELLTVLALVEFQRAGCDAIVWETGLGGRLDCTNAVKAAVSAITPIAFDHEAVLGNTIELIAREKAGIVKRNGIVVLAEQVPEHEATVRRVVEERAMEVDAIVIDAGEGYEILQAMQTRDGMRVTVRELGDEVRSPTKDHTVLLPLHGAHQVRNFLTALTAVDYFTLSTRLCEGVGTEDLLAGAARTNWPGRLEVHPRGAATLVLDGAHCALSAATLGGALAELRRLPDSPIRGEATLLLGMQRDKKHADFLAPLAAAFPIARVIGFTVPGPRAASGEALAEAARALGFASESAATVEEALAKAPEDGTIVVTGSLYALADARRAWESGTVSR